jgi:hypothetical protein
MNMHNSIVITTDADHLRKEFGIKFCGDCKHWMKKGICPKEHGPNTRSPSTNTHICEEFKQDSHKLINEQ